MAVWIILAAGLFLLLTGCTRKDTEQDGYHHISQEEAMKMMEKDDGHLIIDVRRVEEFEEGHIPKAVNIPNETIEEEMGAYGTVERIKGADRYETSAKIAERFFPDADTFSDTPLPGLLRHKSKSMLFS